MSFSTGEAVADVGLIGLAVMGQNLILNLNDHGFTVCAYNRTVEKVERFIGAEAKGTKVVGARSAEEFVRTLKKPRRAIILVQAGAPVDATIKALIDAGLEKGDVIVDGGNSNYVDTLRRADELERAGFLFVGSGVSGGEEGARYGPSIMPGGHEAAWPLVKDMLQAIAAKSDGAPCCDWVGGSGAGHYVKMVHNGIEYGDMQLICEAYHLMHVSLGYTHAQMAAVFDEWNKGELESFLIEITRDILAFKQENGEPLVEHIMDKAGQKGTGKWTVISALEVGASVSLIAEAVFARNLSAVKDDRVAAAKVLKGPAGGSAFDGDAAAKTAFVEAIRQALYASKIISYTQGFLQLRAAAAEHKWRLNYGGIALMWRGGCIIRSVFLGKIKAAFDANPQLSSLLLDDFFRNAVENAQAAWRRVVSQAALLGVPVPAFSTALAYYDGYRTERLPANLLQAQRDYFGAHTYERLDEPGKWVHTNWTGRGGNVSSSTYNA